jgi:hypothetical protein
LINPSPLPSHRYPNTGLQPLQASTKEPVLFPYLEGLAGERGVALPPVDPYAHGLVHRGDEQSHLDVEKFNIGQRDGDIPRDDDALVQYPSRMSARFVDSVA